MFPGFALLAPPVTCCLIPSARSFSGTVIWFANSLPAPESASSTPARLATLGIIDKHRQADGRRIRLLNWDHFSVLAMLGVGNGCLFLFDDVCKASFEHIKAFIELLVGDNQRHQDAHDIAEGPGRDGD